MKDIIYNSNDYDVPQIRNRVIIFGVKKNNEKNKN